MSFGHFDSLAKYAGFPENGQNLKSVIKHPKIEILKSLYSLSYLFFFKLKKIVSSKFLFVNWKVNFWHLYFLPKT